MANNSIEVVALPALKDNYIWCIRNRIHVAVVDPSTADPVIDYLNRKSLSLAAVLNTHHHADHVGGNKALQARYSIPVHGPATETIPCRTYGVKEPDMVTIQELSLSFAVIDIPGHTSGHIAYYGANLLFCGDTLFSCGCGRLFEGTPQQMFRSLQKLASLPNSTQVYCGHEYTLANIRFAKTVDPRNRALAAREQEAQKLIDQGLPTLPSSIAAEKLTNPFLRCEDAGIVAAAQKYAARDLNDPIAVFTVLREWKNNF